MNKAILIGRVTKDIELKTTESRKSIALFTLAVNRDYKNAEGKYDTDFINCVAFGMQAETISKFVHKGDRFGVDGKLSTRTYEKQDGTKVYITEIIVSGFEFLESKKDKPTADVESSGYTVNPNDFEEITNEDLPF